MLKSWPSYSTLLFILALSASAETNSDFIYFEGTNIVSSEMIYEDGNLRERKTYSKSGNLVGWTGWKKVNTSTWQKEKFDGSLYPEKIVLERQEVRFNNDKDPVNSSLGDYQILKEWHIPKENQTHPIVISSFIKPDGTIDAKNPHTKEILNADGEVSSTLKFYYRSDKKDAYRFEEVSNGKIIASYELNEAFTPEKAWEELPQEEILKRRLNLNQKNKFLVAVIDSGFDYNHKDLAHQWFQNPNDPVDGIDNDGNGWIDDFMGWERESGSGFPSESSTALQKDWRPMSHGTHVAHIATRDLWGVGLIGFAGDYTKKEYIDNVSSFLKQHKVRVVNMSFGLPADIKNMMGLRDANKALQRMVTNNPDTLFISASGNTIPGIDIDNFQNRQYPASINEANNITVGSTNSSTLEPDQFDIYEMADFSNFGEKSVDILAPGEDVLAASLGGGQIKHTGTSMASPYMANEVIRLWQKYPSFNAKEIKEIFMNSAYQLPTLPLVKSKGIVDRKAAHTFAKEAFTNKRWGYSQSLEQNKNGPNCWNSSLFNSGIVNSLRHVNAEEFRKTIESPLCKEVSTPEFGDIVALRRTNEEGRPLKGSMFSELHAYTYKSEAIGLTKNGQNYKDIYQEQSHRSIYNKYQNLNRKDCRIYGIPKEYCHLTTKYYRCQTMAQHQANNPEGNEEFYETLERAEKELERYFFSPELEKKEHTIMLPSNLSPALIDIYRARLNTLGMIL